MSESEPQRLQDEDYQREMSARNGGMSPTDTDSHTMHSRTTSEDQGVQATAHPKELEEGSRDPFLIEFEGPDDPDNPLNWAFHTKCIQTMLLATLVFVVAFASSIFSSASDVVAEKFGVSTEVTTLGVALFVLGFALGPLMWGPLSELYGRKLPLMVGYFVFCVFQIPVAVAQNLQTIMLCRFFGGTFASAPLAVIGGAFADFWEPVDRGVAICFFSAATFLGPTLGPVVGAFITESDLGWRWTEYLLVIIGFSTFFIALFFQKESYAPVILQKRAKRLRFERKEWAIRSKLDEKELNFHEIISTYLLRPVKMVATEPILDLMTLYMAFIYGILYLQFEAFPISFQEVRGWKPTIASLPFLSIIVGVLMGSSTIIYITKTRFARKLKEHGKVVPEERMPPMMIGAVVFPIGLFWFAWTSSKHIIWVPQVMSGALIGMGIQMIFLQSMNFLIDVYGPVSNSALAANTFLRSLCGAGFPMFAQALYHTLGVNWATSLLGFLAIAMMPVPFLFFKYGARIRKMSKHALPV